CLATSAIAYGASVAAGTYMIAAEMVGWGVLAFFLVMSLAIALVQALELVETVWRRHWRREAVPAAEMVARQPADRAWPKGALHYVLTQTAPDAKVIGVIDSDYMVRPDWLKAVVPYFDDAKISYVQAPQDHRDWTGDRFKEMLNWEYAGFFDIGMCLRNEYDAIIQHGTMTLVRRDLMEELGGWATWCITEDTELGLRLMEKGYGAMYSRERFGHGLTPDHFAGYKKQRFRWAYGAMQIMKAH